MGPRAATCLASATVWGVLGLAAFLAAWVPQPFPDRLAAIPESDTRIDNVKPFDALEKWASNGSQAGLHRLNPARVAYFHAQIREALRPPYRVLDAGCGGGLVTNALAALPEYRVSGVDMSKPALEYAEMTAQPDTRSTVDFQLSSVYGLPFANESFDAVIMSDVLEHLNNLPRAFAEIGRVLRPGGLFLFDTIDRNWNSFIVAIVGAEWLVRLIDRHTHDWRLFIQPSELKRGLEVSGFRDFLHKSFDPSMRALLELSLFSAGLLSPGQMHGGWSILPPSWFTVSYIGLAVKA